MKSGRSRARLARAGTLAALLCARDAVGDQPGVWTPIGPEAATVFALERDPLNPAVVYAGTYFGGLYSSRDGGLSWNHLGPPFATSTVFAVAPHPTVPGIVYVGTHDRGIYRSQDGGARWTSVQTGAGPVHSVAVDPYEPLTVLAATFDQVLRSTDGGATWVPAPGRQGLAGRTLLFDPGQRGVVYLGTSGKGVFRSADGGETWTALTEGLGEEVVTGLELDPLAPAALYAATGNGVFRLGPDSPGWQDLTFDLPGRSANHVVRHPVTRSLYAATDGGVFRREESDPTHWVRWTDKGARFVLIDAARGLVHVASSFGELLVTSDDGQTFVHARGMQNRFVEGLTTVNAFGQTVTYAATDRSVEFTSEFFRTGGEFRWATGGDFGGGVFDVEPHPTTSSILFAGTEGAGVWKTHDFGMTWAPSSRGIVPAKVFSIDQSAVGEHPLYAGTSFGIFVSRDDGRTWRPNTDTTPRPVSAVLADPVRPGVAYYGTVDGQVLRTFDGGATFNLAWDGAPAERVRQLAAGRWGNLYAVTGAGHLYSSEDLGSHFFRRATEIAYEILSVAVDPARPWVVYVGTSMGGVYKSESDAIEWVAKNDGLDVPIVFSLAIDPGAAATLYAGSLNAVYKSTDGGNRWRPLVRGLPGGAVTQIEVDPTDGSTLYASVRDRGIFRSANGGEDWSLLRRGAPFLDAVPLALSRNDPLVLFAGTRGGGVHRSADRGATWAPSNDGLTVFVKDVAVDPARPDIVYAASLVDGVFKSTDGGANWTSKGLQGRYLFHLAIDPRSRATIYASTPTGITRSLDGGETWVDLGQRMAYVFAIASDPGDRRMVYAGGLGGELFRSVDSGRTWRRAAQGLPALNVLALAVDPRTGAVYASLDRDGVYRSLDAGESWQRTATATIGAAQIGRLAVDARNGWVFAASNGDGLFRTRDGGQTWEELNTGFGSGFVSAVVVDARDGVVFASIFGEGEVTAFFVSEDGGESWQPTGSGLPAGGIFGIALAPHDPNVLFVAAAGGVFRSTDRGESWAPAGEGLEGVSVRRLLVEDGQGAPEVVYAGTAGQGLFRSGDGGATWIPLPGPYKNLDVSDFAPGPGSERIYAATLGHGVIHGEGPAGGLGGGTEANLTQAVVHRVAIDPATPGTLYAATGGAGVIRSVDGGITWRGASQGIDYPFLFSLVVDPLQPQTLYAGTTGGGVFVSDDAALSWRPINEGLFHKRVTSLALDVNDHRVLYAGTEGGGVFRYRR